MAAVVPCFPGQLQDWRLVWHFVWHDVSGGTMMDAGCYCAHTLRFFPGCSQPQVVRATAEKLVDDGQVDGRMTAQLRYPSSGKGKSSSMISECCFLYRWPLLALKTQ